MPKKNQIKFAYPFLKLGEKDIPKQAILLCLEKVDTRMLPRFFLEYDSAYLENGVIQHYFLKRGEGLLLIFFDGDKLFSTLRSCFPKTKEAFLRSKLGEYFDIVIG